MSATALHTLLRAHDNPQRATPMRAYMRNQFAFFGIPTPERRALAKPTLNAMKHAPVDWDFVFTCWTYPEREMQYVACDYLNLVKAPLTPADFSRLEQLVVQKSWWDTVDNLDQIFGRILLVHPESKAYFLQLSQHPNFWLRRIAIDCQLGLREHTDTDLLAQVILNNLGSEEFFINKAIGWSLREYGKTNPIWVQQFVAQHQPHLAPLSVREALRRFK